MARATNLMIGTVTLTAIAIGFVGFLGFRKIHAVQQRGPLRIVFEGSATGLAKGNSVNFDGVQVGEVTSIKLDGPRKIVALATLENSAPIRKDTVVGLEQQGLTGVMAISLVGGSDAAPPVPLDEDGIPTLTADLSEAQSIRDTLHNVDHMLVDNREVIEDALLSFETYTATLAGKGDEIDRVLGKADAAFAGFDNTITKIDGAAAGPRQGQGRRTLSEDKVDPRTRRELQQALRRLHGGRPPLAARYQRSRQQGNPQIRCAAPRGDAPPYNSLVEMVHFGRSPNSRTGLAYEIAAR